MARFIQKLRYNFKMFNVFGEFLFHYGFYSPHNKKEKKMQDRGESKSCCMCHCKKKPFSIKFLKQGMSKRATSLNVMDNMIPFVCGLMIMLISKIA